MILNESIDKLTNAMSARQDRRSATEISETSPEPFILFLGSECARAAKVPDIGSVAEKAIALFGGIEAAKVDRSDTDDVFKTLYKYLDKIPTGLIYNALQSLYVNIPVPLFYQDLAQLVKVGYFNRIITTNFDTLLEQALGGAGMQAGFDYWVTSLGIKSEDGEDQPVTTDGIQLEDGREPVRIIKLHGDLAQQQINLSQARIERALQSQRRFVKSELKGDIVMVGYEFENDPINHWLAGTRVIRDQLWWVSQKPLERSISEWATQVSEVDGEVGRPENFFSQLVLRLLRRPVLESLNKSFKDYASGSGLELAEEVEPAAEADVFDSYGEKDPAVIELRDKIRRSQSVLFQLEQSISGDESIQTQINYQKRQISKFEDRLREHPECRRHIIELVNLIASYGEQYGDRLDSRVLDFWQGQVLVILHEYEEEEQPNQQVISAAIGATVLLGDRLGVDLGEVGFVRETLRKLATYVPSLTARGVI